MANYSGGWTALGDPTRRAIFARLADRPQACRWARVLVYEAPNRIVISWDISPRWQLETNLARTSAVEIRFIAQSSGRELERRQLDGHGQDWEAEREAVRSEGGWPLYLKRSAGD